MPADIGQLTSLEELNLNCNQLTSVPAEIGQLAALELYLGNQLERAGGIEAPSLDVDLKNQPTSVPAEIGQLTPLGS